MQATRLQTLAYLLNDSPVGQLAWIVEKFREWTDPAAQLLEDAVDRDQLLTNVSILGVSVCSPPTQRSAMPWTQQVGSPTGRSSTEVDILPRWRYRISSQDIRAFFRDHR